MADKSIQDCGTTDPPFFVRILGASPSPVSQTKRNALLSSWYPKLFREVSF